jgi:ATP-binding cassette subfamily B protein
MMMLKLYGRVLSMLGSEGRLAVVLAFANIVVALAQFAEPILFGRMVDVLTKTTPSAPAETPFAMEPAMGLWIIAALLSITGGVMISMHADRLSHRRRLAVMAQYFEHVLALPLAFHNATHSGRILKVKLEGTGGMAWIWLSFFRDHFSAMVLLLVLLPLSLVLNLHLGLILLGLLLVFSLLTAYVLNKTQVLQAAVESHHSSLAEQASDALGNISVVQSFTRIEWEAAALRRTISDLLLAQVPVLSWWALASIITRASASISMLLIFVTGARLHQQGLASVGEVVGFMSLSGLLVMRMEQLVSFINHLFLHVPKLAEFFEVLDTKPMVANHPDAVDPGRLVGEVSFDHVSYSFTGRERAVHDLSLTVKAGQRIALVGETGSGKSTTLALLYRAFDPQQGSIRIDGIDVRSMTLEGLRRNVGVVFQEPMLFARSIRDNVLIGAPDASEEAVWQALARAQAEDFVTRSPAGLATIVGERGRSLSGGERQRIAIARALLKNPPLLILDEATAALDAGTEARLQNALEEVMAGRTTFIIAHRLATVRQADLIVVFERGRIVETGQYDSLIAQKGRFAALAQAQFMTEAS